MQKKYDDYKEIKDLKIDQVKKEYTLYKKYYPIIEKNLHKNENTLFRHIGKYRDKYIDILSSIYLTNYPKFGPNDINIIFKVTGVDKDELDEDINRVTLPPWVKKKNKVVTAFPILLLLMMNYYLQNKQEKKAEMLYYYYGYSVYWMAYTVSFKKFLPKEEVMHYTINNLTNKFILKQLGSVDALIYYSVNESIISYRERLMRASDYELFYIIGAIRTRIGNYVKKIANEFYINNENKEVILMGDDTLEEGGQREVSSIAGDVETLAQEYTTKFFSEAPRQNIINKAAKIKGISASELKNTLTLLVDKQSINEVLEFYQALFYVYLVNNKTSRKYFDPKLFLGIMEGVYKKGNSLDKNILKIKELMNKWLEEGSLTYRATNRQATLNDFRKAIFYYFVFLVAFNN